ncbi:MAG: HAD hydrolase family protein [Phycisphaerales bacterium]|jgi:hydroxymethylpyrimidine pyrophosphatase-like HAD family hydrolase|nr:HAD hydrolase family protein [Phycisphaerales bacterium]
MPARSYDLIAIDLDGTLLPPGGKIGARTRGAIDRAREAGYVVTICTGRGLLESMDALSQIEQRDPVVVAGGSMVACPVTRRTLARTPVDPEIVGASVERFLAHGHAALVFKDSSDTAYDYLVVTGEPQRALDPVTLWWFAKMCVRVRFVERLDQDEHPGHTLRVGACGVGGRLRSAMIEVKEKLGPRAMIHQFPAVSAPEHLSKLPQGESLHIVEVFDARATKWTALQHVLSERGIDASRVVAIGDEINDLDMITHAGLGVAMGNAIPTIKDAAKRHAPANHDEGVAYAIERVLDGQW